MTPSKLSERIAEKLVDGLSYHLMSPHGAERKRIIKLAEPLIAQEIEPLERELGEIQKKFTPPKELTRFGWGNVPDHCPECDSRDFISAGGMNYVCAHCWLLSENDKLETKLAKQSEAVRKLLRAAGCLLQFVPCAPLDERIANSFKVEVEAAAESLRAGLSKQTEVENG